MRLSKTLFFLLFIFTFQHVQAANQVKTATEKETQCDEQDKSCQSNINANPTASPEAFTDDSAFSTLIAAASYETVSSFHEAKVAHPAPPLALPPLVEGQPTNLPGFDLPNDASSGIDQNTPPFEEEKPSSSGISRVETAVLSACGVLVVAGIAVGIFVWRNTTRSRQNHSDLELDYEYDEGQENNGQQLVHKNEIRLNPIFSNKLQHASPMTEEQQRQSEGDAKHQLAQEQYLNTSATFSPVESHTIDQPLVLTSHHLRNSLYGPMFGGSLSMEPNIQSLSSSSSPSIMNIAQSPTALTYPLQKFLKSPISANHIPLHWDSPNSDTDDISISDDLTQVDIQETTSQNSRQADNLKRQSSKLKHSLGQQLSNLFSKTPSTSQNTKPLFKMKKPSIKRNESHLAIDVYTNKPASASMNGPEFFSPLGLPENQYVPMRDAIGLPLVSRAEVLADPVRRLGEDEIALWEENKRKKAIAESSLVSSSTLATLNPTSSINSTNINQEQ